MMKVTRDSLKINATKDYAIFQDHATENRALNLKKHRLLRLSMKRWGFLACYPIICYRDSRKHLIVWDGQHRLAIAKELGLTVYWVEVPIDSIRDPNDGLNLATINSTPIRWSLRDFAEKFAAAGKKDYQEALDFMEEYRVPIGTAFAILAGTVSWGNIADAFFQGKWRIKEREFAETVATLYSRLSALSPAIRNARMLAAAMAVCRVKEFDVRRLINGASRCREKLVSYSTKDAYLDLFEDIYNYNRRELFGLKAAAIMAMRERSAAKTQHNGAH